MRTSKIVVLSISLHLLLIYLANMRVLLSKDKQPLPVDNKLLHATLVVMPPVRKKSIVVTQPITPEKVINKQLAKVNRRAKDEQTDITTDNKQVTASSVVQESIKTAPIKAHKPAIKRVVSTAAILDGGRRYLSAQRSQVAPYIPRAKATTSLMTGVPTGHQYKVVDKSIEAQRQLKISCDTGVKKTLAILSGITGGTVVCDAQPDLSQFLPKPRNSYKD